MPGGAERWATHATWHGQVGGSRVEAGSARHGGGGIQELGSAGSLGWLEQRGATRTLAGPCNGRAEAATASR